MGERVPQWDPANLMNHFNSHGREFPYQTFLEYEESSLAAIRKGRRFTYTDPSSGRPRIGYYDAGTGRFTVVTANRRRIVTHYPATERYVRTLPDSTYT